MKNYLTELKEVQTSLNILTTKVDALIYEHELPHILETITKYKKGNGNKKVTISWLQKEFRIGYAHAARLSEEVNHKPQQ